MVVLSPEVRNSKGAGGFEMSGRQPGEMSSRFGLGKCLNIWEFMSKEEIARGTITLKLIQTKRNRS